MRITCADGTCSAGYPHHSRWAVTTSDQGPVYLGYRLGHVRGDTRILRAVVYNKGARCCTCFAAWSATMRSSEE